MQFSETQHALLQYVWFIHTFLGSNVQKVTVHTYNLRNSIIYNIHIIGLVLEGSGQ